LFGIECLKQIADERAAGNAPPQVKPGFGISRPLQHKALTVYMSIIIYRRQN
jgi:hypothetical protein